MKTALLRFLHLFMAVIVLLSSMGFGLVEHSCQVQGKRVYSIYRAKPGCQLCKAQTSAATKTPTIRRTDCCKDEARYSRVEATSSLSQLLAKFIKSLSETVGAGVAAVSAVLYGNLLGFLTHIPAVYYESPPPLAGRALLAFVQTYLI